jgi:hypothetical protein
MTSPKGPLQGEKEEAIKQAAIIKKRGQTLLPISVSGKPLQLLQCLMCPEVAPANLEKVDVNGN